MSMIFAPSVVEVNPFGADLFRLEEPVASVGHLADDMVPEPDWDALAEDAAMDAAWDLACENGYLPC